MDYKAKVFLSGGFKSNWQSKIIKELQNQFFFFNPKNHGLNKSKLYTAWDIHFVKECDIIFAYMENTNPSGYGIALEVGIAYSLGKTIILIDERSENDLDFANYFKIVHESSNVVFTNYDEGKEFLLKFSV